MTLSDMGQAALELLTTNEWSVFPVCRPIQGSKRCEQHGECESPGKHPMVRWREYKERLPTEEEVTRWWTIHPTANIGIATGRISGIGVIDVDNNDAWAKAQELGFDPDCAVVTTGKIGGRHLYFAWRDDAPTIFSKSYGLDWRGEGGFVLAPPSFHKSGALYRWESQPGHSGAPLPPIPRWIDDLATSGREGLAGEHIPIDVARLLDEGIPEGERNQTVYRTACKLRGLDFPFIAALDITSKLATQCGLPLEEAERVTRNAYEQFAPNEPPMEGFPEGMYLDAGPWIIERNGHKVEVATGEVVEKEYPLITMGRYVDKRPEPRRELIEHVLWEGSKHWVYGMPGCGKTLFYSAALLHLADGRRFGDFPVVQGGALILQEDTSSGVYSEYIQNMASAYEIELGELPVLVNEKLGMRVTDEAGLKRAIQTIEDARAVLADTFGERGQLRVVMFDASESLAPSESYGSRELDPFLRLLSYITNLGIAVIVIDHSKKVQADSKEKINVIDSLHGGRGKSRVSDVMCYMAGNIATGGQLQFVKFRGEPQPNIEMKFESGMFSIGRVKPELRGNDQLVQRLFNNWRGDPMTKQEVALQIPLPQKTADRVVDKAVQDGRLTKIDGRPARYEITRGVDVSIPFSNVD